VELYSPATIQVVLVVCLVFSVLMILFGRWGQKNAGTLLPANMVKENRTKKQQQVRRGGITWQIVGVIFAIISIVGLITAWNG
jgi:hypothetical protein